MYEEQSYEAQGSMRFALIRYGIESLLEFSHVPWFGYAH